MPNELGIRQNGIGGLVDDNPLTNVATTLTSSALSALQVIDSTQFAWVIIDPDGIDGAPEHIKITAHSAGATTATILRGQGGTTARQHVAGTPWIHGPVAGDFYPELASASWGESVSASSSYPFFIAPVGCVIVASALEVHDASIAASDTNYWSITLRRYRANVSADIATKTTRVTGGEAIANRTTWNFDASTFHATNKILLAGDILDMAFVPTGTPTAISKFHTQARWERT